MGMALLVVGGFLYWVLATTPGGRWALVTATMQVGGSVSGVSGSVWHGLHIDHLAVPNAGSTLVEIVNLDLQVQWKALLERQLHIENLSMDRLDVGLTSADDPDTADEPFSMPALPIQVRADRLALSEFSLTINGESLPVELGGLVASLYLDEAQGQLRVNRLDVGHEHADVALEADLRLLGLTDPWPLDGVVQADVRGKGEDSILCARYHLPTLPRVVDGPRPASPESSMEEGGAYDEVVDMVAPVDACSLNLHLAVDGSLQALTLDTRASGQGMNLDAVLNLAPSAAFPLRDARLDLTLADESSLRATLHWDARSASGSGSGEAGHHDEIQGTLETTRLDLSALTGSVLPQAVLTASGRFQASLVDRNRLLSSSVELDIADGSIWNGQSLQGMLNAAVVPLAGGQDPGVSVAGWRSMQLKDLELDVQLGGNHVQARGGLGSADSELVMDVQAPQLSGFWPDLPGGLELQARAGGAVSDHALTLDATYTPAEGDTQILGQAPVRAALDIEGGWRQMQAPDRAAALPALEGWDGRIRGLEVRHDKLALLLEQMPSLRIVPGATTADGLWALGQAELVLSLENRRVLQLSHVASSGGAAGQWSTKGGVGHLEISPALIEDIEQIVRRLPGHTENDKAARRGGVIIRGADNDVTELALALDWDLNFSQALGGTLNVRRLSGDVMVPSEPPFALGLQTLSVDVAARPVGDSLSQLAADLSVVTADMGRVDANVALRLRAGPSAGFAIEPGSLTATVNADIDDLGWVSLFAGDAMEFAGHIKADVTLASLADGRWDSSGVITGTDIRIVRIDDGVRLLDGTLAARLENDRIILERLEFPARLRVEPKEWRTAEWVSTNPDARDGYLRLAGEWSLSDATGDLDIELHRYPVLQRSDRYAMVTGALHIQALLPALSITGRVEADAGWIDLDMLGGIPTVDSDVVIIRAGEEPAEINVPMDISMDIEVDLGPRVYLTGYGVNSGLVGNMRVMMIDNKLTAVGALRTRGGAIEAYGQRLQLRRGTITFQGDIANPILSIEALRTGFAVEAGVRVSGTARRPSIDLVSYPEVSEIEKLSWLLFGHGPDESGGDMALLLSVGTSLLGDGEPFYRKFGIDELSLQSGDIGSAGSILPAESVVSGLNSGASDLERQFISASKGIAAGFTVSVRQALSDAGTVGRVSYRLARGLTAELSVGSVNGLALVYRWFSRSRR